MFTFLTGNFRLYAIIAAVLALVTAFWYVSGLRGDLAESEANNRVLKDAITTQQQTIDQLQKDSNKIKESTDRLTTTIRSQNKDLENLRRKFNSNTQGNERNFSKDAAKNPNGIETEVNQISKNLERCLEIASGSPLTEGEKNATKPNEINQECPSLANPNYRSSAN